MRQETGPARDPFWAAIALNLVLVAVCCVAMVFVVTHSASRTASANGQVAMHRLAAHGPVRL